MAQLSVALVAVVVVMAVTGGGRAQAQQGNSCVDGNRQAGTCISIRNCEPLRRLLGAVRANTAGPNGIQVLRQSVCGFQNNNQILVCCAVTPAPRPPGGGGPVTPAPQPSAEGGRGLLPRRCGVTGLTDRIIDGEDAPLLAWPWMAVLRGRIGAARQSSWFCGGILISDRYVLTAAHCFKRQFNVQLEFVRLGEHTLSKNPDCEHGLCAPTPQDIPVEQIISHPQYESPCKECNDIALLRLSRPARLHPIHVVPVCLPVDPLNDMGFTEQEFQGKFAWAAGWGSTARNPLAPVSPDKLQQVLVPISDGEFCRNLRKDYPDPLSTLCAGGEGKDTCKGDSGGPLLLNNRGETKRFVVGITSLGPSVCGLQNTQGLYSNVHYYVPWILQNLRP